MDICLARMCEQKLREILMEDCLMRRHLSASTFMTEEIPSIAMSVIAFEDPDEPENESEEIQTLVSELPAHVKYYESLEKYEKELEVQFPKADDTVWKIEICDRYIFPQMIAIYFTDDPFTFNDKIDVLYQTWVESGRAKTLKAQYDEEAEKREAKKVMNS